jgi:hypothetical protein
MLTKAPELAGNVLLPIYSEANADDSQDLSADVVRLVRTAARGNAERRKWRAR